MATTAHGLVYPDDYDDKADVPTALEAIAVSVEAALVSQDTERAAMVLAAQAAGPLGAIIAYGGLTAPTGWHLCNGTAHGSAALQALIGSANTPDLRDRFIVGAGSSYSRGATGGAATVTLTSAQSGLPAHSHPAAASSDSADHTHSGTTGAMSANASHTHTVTGSTAAGEGKHQHIVAVYEGTEAAGDGSWVDTAPAAGGGGALVHVGLTADAGAHVHVVSGSAAATSVAHTHAFTTGGRSAFHQHTITVSANTAANAASAHENRPPYYALVYIIKKV